MTAKSATDLHPLTIYFPSSWSNRQGWEWMKQRYELIPYALSYYCEKCGKRHTKTTQDLAEELMAMMIVEQLFGGFETKGESDYERN